MKKTLIDPKEITSRDKNRAVLYINKGQAEFGVLSHCDHIGVHVYFGMNEEPLALGTAELYWVEVGKP